MGRLSASAAPFVPSFHPSQASTSHQQQQLQQQEPAQEQQEQQQQQQQQQDPDQEEWPDQTAAYDAEADWGSWPYQEQHEYDDSGQDAAGDDDSGSGWGAEAAQLSVADAVELLASWYPGQPRPVVQQVFEACSCLQEASDILGEMEREQRLAARSAATRTRPGMAVVEQQQPGFELQTDAFPGLSAGVGADATKQQQQRRPSSSSCPGPAVATGTAAGAWDGPASSSASAAAGSSWAAVATKAAAAAAAAGQASRPAADAGGWPSLGASGATASRSSAAARQGMPSSSSSSSTSAAAAAGAAVPWVSTGAAVTRQYEAARAAARDHARVRNACFHQATIAYLRGDKALAKELSARGKAAAEQMFAAHDLASQQLFAQRNTRPGLGGTAGSTGGSSSVIDLHGLHVREVQAVLVEQLQQLAARRCRSVSLIVGTGHHTKGPRSARLGPAVEQLLQAEGYSYSQPQPGLLKVQLLS